MDAVSRSELLLHPTIKIVAKFKETEVEYMHISPLTYK